MEGVGTLLTQTSAQAAGVETDKLDAAFAIVAGWIDEGVIPGAVALDARRGRIAGVWAGGHLSSAPGAPLMRPDTVFPVASITKIVTATAVLRQVDEGKLGIETLVKDILPEWSVPGAERIKVRHLLSHTSGLPEDLAEGVLRYEDRNSVDTIIDLYMQV